MSTINNTNGLDAIVQLVTQFHQAFGHPVAETIKPLSLERSTSRAVWTGEEAVVEFLHQSSTNEEEFLAAYNQMIAGLENAKRKSLGMPYPKNDIEKIIGQSDALVDATYFIGGSFAEIGIAPHSLFEIVQEANMAKLGPDGKPIIRESDGKIMKPEGWEPPEAKLEQEILRQINEK